MHAVQVASWTISLLGPNTCIEYRAACYLCMLATPVLQVLYPAGWWPNRQVRRSTYSTVVLYWYAVLPVLVLVCVDTRCVLPVDLALDLLVHVHVL